MRRQLRVLFLLAFGSLLAWAWSAQGVSLTRGPFLQDESETGIKLVCRTSGSASLTLSYGLQAGPPWSFQVSSPSGTTHVFTLSGLLPESTYHYQLASGSTILAGGSDYLFRTAPPAQSRAPFRFLAFGDSGTGQQPQFDVAAHMIAASPWPELALGLGDLVYDNGEAANYDPRLFTPYAQIFRRMTFWPTIGNHDVRTNNGQPYLDAFYLPTDTGAPGLPSNSERYYAFDRGMAHFVCVDSESTDTTPGGPMSQWLTADLDDAVARNKRWIIVFMHHPPYTRGTHDSTTEQELITLHQNLVPIYDAHGVDMVLVGHSHVYERSYLVKNDAILQVDPSNYDKIHSPDGTLYLVSGCAAKLGTGPLDHPLMASSQGNVRGFNLIDVNWNELHGSFIDIQGNTTDLFTLRKGFDHVPPRVVSGVPPGGGTIVVTFSEPVQLGSGTNGAENPANYWLTPRADVLSATLASDQRTVTLHTSPLATECAYRLSVARVADPDGNQAAQDFYLVRHARSHVLATGAGAGPAPEGGLPRGDPLVVLSAPVRAANAPARLSFSAASERRDSGLRLVWDFGDGSAPAFGPEAEHLYTDPGLFTVSLIAEAPEGRTAVEQTSVRVLDQGLGPAVKLSGATPGAVAGIPVAFSSSGSIDPDGGPLYLLWDFGDPASGDADHSAAAAPEHVYASPGSYRVTLTVVDDEGSTSQAHLQLDVAEAPAPSGD